MPRPYRRTRSALGRDRLAAVLRAAGGLVTVQAAARALDLEARAAAKILARWAEQGWLKRLRRGLYAPIPIDALSSAQTLENPWVLVPRLFAPGYVGGWSAAEHWGLTEQIFRDVCVLTAKPVRRKRELIEGTPFALHRISERAIFGTAAVWVGKARVAVSDPARTLVDVLARPALGGGIRHVAECLDAYLHSPARDLGKLIAYGDRLGNGAVFKRLGFLLSARRGGDPEVIEACRRRIKTGNVKLDSRLGGERLVSAWKLWVPRRWKIAAQRD
jgi:predicted transcriptional regulator of viral defense system